MDSRAKHGKIIKKVMKEKRKTLHAKTKIQTKNTIMMKEGVFHNSFKNHKPLSEQMKNKTVKVIKQKSMELPDEENESDEDQDIREFI